LSWELSVRLTNATDGRRDPAPEGLGILRLAPLAGKRQHSILDADQSDVRTHAVPFLPRALEVGDG
jgi:hypothetical protein